MVPPRTCFIDPHQTLGLVRKGLRLGAGVELAIAPISDRVLSDPAALRPMAEIEDELLGRCRGEISRVGSAADDG